VTPLLERLLSSLLPIALRFWDGTSAGPPDAPVTAVIRSPDALRRLLYAPNELGLARAYVNGEVEIEGQTVDAVRVLMRAAPDDLRLRWRTVASMVRAARALGFLGRPLPPPPEEARVHGWLHSRRRDAVAVTHHYDVGNDFYRLVLDETMTYSCARFTSPTLSLDEAQRAKHELICQKLGLREGMSLLDVGCGWGTMLLHAARRHGVRALGVTLSVPQAELAAKRVAEAGLANRVEVRVQDYRDLVGRFDAVSSIGMFEHVGHRRAGDYFRVLAGVLAAGGRLLNQAISTPGGSRYGRRSFISRYVFPDGELQDVSAVCAGMQAAGLEVRDVECLREHYALTLRRWVANLEEHWDEAVALVGERRARVWRLYMAGSIVRFEENKISLHQVLAVKPDDGTSGLPLARSGWG